MSMQLQRLRKPAFVEPANGPRTTRGWYRELDQPLESAP